MSGPAPIAAPATWVAAAYGSALAATATANGAIPAAANARCGIPPQQRPRQSPDRHGTGVLGRVRHPR
ncbi:hypothetical protein F0344_28885 [Streptomyces finlayi]|uniref:Uncharacterized protein n=1 Tax=Streptomyces finlayi TaxID=67296 RepID=A0A7G7BRW1_9ACTN|nr:hypothetical protein [Streptomyces finlayi]QNE78076.1 hypothetical protein F0344_28885 [Streptomyces finlayi]